MMTAKKAIDQKGKNLDLRGIRIMRTVIIHGDRERKSKMPSSLHNQIRSREWTPKINNGELPISYENDLCLMYSTTIMRFLNHISNIGHTKQTSLFQIAKQLNIPEWIVNLRHDTAHGYELPSIGLLRIAINILLTWLHVSVCFHTSCNI